MHTWGDISILEKHKTGFLCSRKCSAQSVLRSFDWAKEQRRLGNCIVCGNHSQIEKDVFEILLKGKQPLILVLARSFYKQWPKEIEDAVSDERLLVISPFEKTTARVSRDTAAHRNTEIIQMSEKIVVGYLTQGGQLGKLLDGIVYEKL
jgi:predicted Rossmann fold nucleotide-binding protein DprA/Smf involved in DNA uptake